MTACNPYVIEAIQLGYQLGQKHLVHNINWQVNKGEHWVIFGMNGCGKTTLLSMIAGYGPYTNGTLKVLGEEYNEDNVFSLRKKIGWVSSSYFDKHFNYETALTIVLSGLNGTLGLSPMIGDSDVRKAKRLLVAFQLQEKMNQPFYNLSKGERQNVLIARALIANPEVLLLDEPGTGLDIYARERMLHIVRLLAEKQKTTIIYVTHYTEEILPMFEHCMLMKEGRIFKQGKTDELFQKQVLEDFLAHPVQLCKNNQKHYIAIPEEHFYQMDVRESR